MWNDVETNKCRQISKGCEMREDLDGPNPFTGGPDSDRHGEAMFYDHKPGYL